MTEEAPLYGVPVWVTSIGPRILVARLEGDYCCMRNFELFLEKTASGVCPEIEAFGQVIRFSWLMEAIYFGLFPSLREVGVVYGGIDNAYHNHFKKG